MTAKAILGLIPTIQAAQLAGANYDLAMKKKKKPSDFVKTGAGTMIGAEFIKAESNIIAGL